MMRDHSSSDDRTSATIPRKRARFSWYVVIAAVAVTAILLAAFVALPALKVTIAQSLLHNGDYVEYSISGQALFIPISGTARIEISNVTGDGFTATIRTTGIPGGGTETIDHGWDEPLWADLDIGSKVGTAQVSTPWGVKTVDKYFLQNGSENTTTYLGSDPEIIYRADVESPAYSMTMVIADTNIDMIKIGNS